MGEPGNGYDGSSGEEDGDAAWRAAINTVAGTTSYISSFMNGFSAASNGKSATRPSDSDEYENDDQQKPKTQQIKHYQVKVSTSSLQFWVYLFSNFLFRGACACLWKLIMSL